MTASPETTTADRPQTTPATAATTAEPSCRSRRRRGRGRVLAVVVLLLVAAGGAAYAWSLLSPPPPPAWRTATAAVGTVERTVTAVGSLQPKNYVDVGAQVSGQLRALHVEIGDKVEEGQLLAEIDARVYTARVEANRAQIKDLEAQRAMQQAQLELAEAQYRRNERLFRSNAASQDALDISRTDAAVARARIASLQAQLEQARSNLEADEANLSYTRIYAPMAGTVVSQEAVAGQTLNTNQSAPVIMRIAELDTMTLKAQVAEADIVRLSPGMVLEFSTLGMADRRWSSSVRQIRPTPQIVNDVVLYDVLADVPNPDMVLMTDMTAQVFFIEGRESDVVTVPLAALQGGGRDDGAPSVRVLKGDGSVETRAVTVGLRTRTEAAIRDGLAAGETVIVGEQAPARRTGSPGANAAPGMGPRP
ncbi:efflux RND transporter periplasmic adaptor subunit [Caenispirillum bisanense]|uniref:efflux RND transporter periplasmic adaptor subunit n=1 Tax=Caenispirillum bisanense TaxID=414052 RepID=UPI0031DA132A